MSTSPVLRSGVRRIDSNEIPSETEERDFCCTRSALTFSRVAEAVTVTTSNASPFENSMVTLRVVSPPDLITTPEMDLFENPNDFTRMVYVPAGALNAYSPSKLVSVVRFVPSTRIREPGIVSPVDPSTTVPTNLPDCAKTEKLQTKTEILRRKRCMAKRGIRGYFNMQIKSCHVSSRLRQC